MNDSRRHPEEKGRSSRRGAASAGEEASSARDIDQKSKGRQPTLGDLITHLSDATSAKGGGENTMCRTSVA